MLMATSASSLTILAFPPATTHRDGQPRGTSIGPETRRVNATSIHQGTEKADAEIAAGSPHPAARLRGSSAASPSGPVPRARACASAVGRALAAARSGGAERSKTQPQQCLEAASPARLAGRVEVPPQRMGRLVGRFDTLAHGGRLRGLRGCLGCHRRHPPLVFQCPAGCPAFHYSIDWNSCRSRMQYLLFFNYKLPQ